VAAAARACVSRPGVCVVRCPHAQRWGHRHGMQAWCGVLQAAHAPPPACCEACHRHSCVRNAPRHAPDLARSASRLRCVVAWIRAVKGPYDCLDHGRVQRGLLRAEMREQMEAVNAAPDQVTTSEKPASALIGFHPTPRCSQVPLLSPPHLNPLRTPHHSQTCCRAAAPQHLAQRSTRTGALQEHCGGPTSRWPDGE
jgi:hypothetical protein